MPMMAAICGMPIADITALLRNTRPKSSVSGNTSSCRAENAGGIHQIDRRNTVLNGDILGANHFLRGHGEKCAGLHRGVVGDDHHQPGVNARQAGDHAGGRRASPFFVHAVSGVLAQLEKGSGVDQQIDALARGQASFAVLALDGFGSAALANLFFLIANLRDQVGQKAHVGFKARGGGVHPRLQHGGDLRQPGSRRSAMSGELKALRYTSGAGGRKRLCRCEHGVS